jgi:PQQ-dependent dehydrogenase (methanol/ethanol family)
VRGKRLAIVLVLAAGGVLIALLATGTLSKKTGGQGAAIPTTQPNAPSTTAPGAVTQPAEGGVQYSPDDWPSYGGTFDEIRHSPLTLITKQNVNTLGRVATIDFRRIDPAIPKGEQSFPVVVNGIIYVTTADDFVFAIDGGSGKTLWEWKPSNLGVFANYGVNANRGVAVCDGRVFVLTLDMNIVALDQATGKLLQQVPISDSVPGADAQYSYSETQAPICYNNILVIGASGSDYGVRGFAMAYNAGDLSAAWPSPYWIIPPDGTQWRSFGAYTGGGTNWNPGTIDPTTGTLYITTSNPSPIFDPQVRPGPDPRTDSLVALNLYTGRQLWWQQQIPGDQWGYSTVQPALLYTVKINGKRRKVVSVATKEGTWWMYDAKTGQPIYEHIKLINQLEHPALKPGHNVTVYPSSLGGLNYSPSSFDPTTGYVINNQAETASVLCEKSNPAAIGKYKIKGDVDNGLCAGTFGYSPKGWHDYGSITAVNAALGRLVWRHVVPEPGRGGVTTTATGLAFAGGGDGNLLALDTYTGNQLWSFQTGYQIAAGPAIYEVHGKEYIAITVGGTATSSFGGTAAQLQIFTLNGNQTQSPSPPIRAPGPGPGLLRAPPMYFTAGAQPHTVTLQLVSSLNNPACAPVFNGLPKGQMTVKVPQGWTVYVTFANQGQDCSDGAVVASSPGSTTPVFGGGSTAAGGVKGPSNAYFHFTASSLGKYVMASTVPSRATAGEWIHFDVVPASSPPELTVPNVIGQPQTYAIIGRPGLGGSVAGG